MNPASALHYLYDLQRIGIKFGLNNTRRLLHALGDPHLNLRVIHISGTNGKGSTAAMIASILKNAGYKTGLYTSPHLVDLAERIQINGRLIPEEELIKGAEEIRDTIQRINFTDAHPTYFEAVTCLAFSYFSRQQVDFAVMEAGMGGRLDATNVCIPEVTVITSISFDHQEYLGHTLQEITGEKAGIIKKGCPLVCGATQKEVIEVISQVCTSRESLLYFTSDLYHFHDNNSQVHIRRKGNLSLTLTPKLLGKFQIQNMLLAIEAIQRLREGGATIPDDAIVKGIQNTVWPGRVQVISRNPYLILDGAHNPSAAQSLAEVIPRSFRYKNLILLLGILQDKDREGICRSLLPLARHLIISSPQSERAASPEALYNIVKGLSFAYDISLVPQISAAIKMAQENAQSDDLILITGSLYTIGEAMSALGIHPFPQEG